MPTLWFPVGGQGSVIIASVELPDGVVNDTGQWTQWDAIGLIARDATAPITPVNQDDWYDLEWDENVVICEPGEVGEPNVLRAPLEYDLSPAERSLLLAAFSRTTESAVIPVSFDSENEPDGRERDTAD